MKKLCLFFAAVGFLSMGSYAQKITTVKGNPSVIKGESNVALVFTYEDLKVGKLSEADYVTREIMERNDKKPGTGEEWHNAWKEDRSRRYEPKFEKLFNKAAGELFGTQAKINASNAKYTIKINTTVIEPGFNVGVTRKPAAVSMKITLFETANPSTVIYECILLKSPGTSMGNDYDAGERISEAYAKAGKEFAQVLFKNFMK
jgi:ABC-type cobalt transport system substrate-binding protein